MILARVIRALASAVVLFISANVAFTQDERAVNGVWSTSLTASRHAAWRVEDYCPTCNTAIGFRHLESLLADPANDHQTLPELFQEVRRIEGDYLSRLTTASYSIRRGLGSLRRFLPAGDSAMQCDPPGHLIQVLNAPLPLSIEVRDDRVVLHQQDWNVVRRIALGRAPRDLDRRSSIFGLESARFEGSTLIVETRDVPAFTGNVSMVEGSSIVERYTPQADGLRLEVLIVIDDPASYREPLVLRRVMVRTPDVELVEYEDCEGVSAERE